MIPTTRALWLAALSLVPAAIALLEPAIAPALLIFDAALLALIVIDFFRAPTAGAFVVTRTVAPIISSGRESVVELQLTLAPGVSRALVGELRDFVSPGPKLDGHHQRFVLRDFLTLRYRVTPSTRGALHFGPLTVRLEGPLGLAARQVRVELHDEVKVFPDLTALSHDALTLARAEANPSRVLRVRADGREFESLREYRAGDEPRAIDWKATARRGKPLVRRYQPEKNQQVLLLLDCGRHMTGEIAGRRKLDHAVDAALRLSKLALDQGDLVGVLAYAAEVQAFLPPRRGLSQLRALAQALYRVEASLEESDLGAALDTAFRRGTRRSLVVVLTDLFDPDAARSLVARTARLTPKHLPLIISLQDEAVHHVATEVPATESQVFERFAAARLEREQDSTVHQLRNAGAHVVRGPPSSFAGAGASAYLDIKARGLL